MKNIKKTIASIVFVIFMFIMCNTNVEAKVVSGEVTGATNSENGVYYFDTSDGTEKLCLYYGNYNFVTVEFDRDTPYYRYSALGDNSAIMLSKSKEDAINSSYRYDYRFVDDLDVDYESYDGLEEWYHDNKSCPQYLLFGHEWYETLINHLLVPYPLWSADTILKGDYTLAIDDKHKDAVKNKYSKYDNVYHLVLEIDVDNYVDPFQPTTPPVTQSPTPNNGSSFVPPSADNNDIADVNDKAIKSLSDKSAKVYSCGKGENGFLVKDISSSIISFTSVLYNILQIIVPIILVVLGSIDMIKGIMAQKEEEIKKGQNTFIKRLITAIIIFLVFAIVKFLVGVVDKNNGSRIISCMDCFIKGTGACNAGGNNE